MGNSAEPFLQSCIVQPQMTRDGIHAVFSGQFNCSLPHRIRQSLSPWLGATNLIQLELELRDRLRNDCCAHATRPRPLFGGSSKVPRRVSDRHACLPETHASSRRISLRSRHPSSANMVPAPIAISNKTPA